MNLLALLLILLIGGTFIVAGAIIPFVNRFSPRRRLAAAIGSAFLVIGAAGFFGPALSAAGGLDWLPASFEWPAGYVDGVISMPDGTHIVPHDPSGRVQVYDANWRFVRGWRVSAGGGIFKLLPNGDDRFDVITSRGRQRFTYTLNGKLISNASYAPASYESFPDLGRRTMVPTRPWLFVFSNPLYAWLCIMLGAVILMLVERTRRSRGRTT